MALPKGIRRWRDAARLRRPCPGRAGRRPLDTEHLFGFTEGSDIGAPPERALESETTARLGRRGGRYRAVDSALVLKLPLSDRFRLAPGVTFARTDIGGVPGLDDRQATSVSGGFVEARARLLRRDEAPFGLTLNTVAGGNRVDPATGLGARGVTMEAALLIDREIVPGQLVAAVNLAYAIGHARLDGSPGAQLTSGLEVSGALAGRLAPGLFLGAEARYLRAYRGGARPVRGRGPVSRTQSLYGTAGRHLGLSHLGRASDRQRGRRPRYARPDEFRTRTKRVCASAAISGEETAPTLLP